MPPSCYRNCGSATASARAGPGQLKRTVFRIGHIGWFDIFDIVTSLAAVELSLRQLGVDVEAVPPCRCVRSVRAHSRVTRKVLVSEPIADTGLELLRSTIRGRCRRRVRSAEIIGDYEAIVIRSGDEVDAPS